MPKIELDMNPEKKWGTNLLIDTEYQYEGYTAKLEVARELVAKYEDIRRVEVNGNENIYSILTKRGLLSYNIETLEDVYSIRELLQIGKILAVEYNRGILFVGVVKIPEAFIDYVENNQSGEEYLREEYKDFDIPIGEDVR